MYLFLFEKEVVIRILEVGQVIKEKCENTAFVHEKLLHIIFITYSAWTWTFLDFTDGKRNILEQKN